MSKILEEIKAKLYSENEYGYKYQDSLAVLEPNQIKHMETNYGLKTEASTPGQNPFPIHSMCVNCQARQLIKYKGFVDDNGKKNSEFAVKCNFVPKGLPPGSRTLLNKYIAENDMDPERALLYLKSTIDPVSWCELMFGFRDGDAKWGLRSYQKEQLRCNSLRYVIREGRRSGKALPLDTPIPSPNGWTTMGDLRTGDTVFSDEGKATTVTFTTETMYDHDCYEIVFDDGSVIVADAEHQWDVSSRSSRRRFKQGRLGSDQVTITTEKMIDRLKIGVKKPEFNYRIKLTQPVQYNSLTALPVDPYVLGYWLGDGVRNTGRIIIGEEDLVESVSRIQAAGYRMRVGGSSAIDHCVYGLITDLKALGIENAKRIPADYLRAPVDQRWEVLKGLMDSDGSVDEAGHCEYSSSDPLLAQDFYELATGLGLKITRTVGPSFFNGVRHKDRTRFYFNTYKPAFNLERKLKRQMRPGRIVREYRAIVEIRSVATVPVRCITVDSPNSLYLAGEQHLVTHNTFAIALKLVYLAFNLRQDKGVDAEGQPVIEGPEIVIITPYQAQVTNIFDEMEKLLKRNKALVQRITTAKGGGTYIKTPYYHMEMDNGASISGFVSGVGGREDGSGGGSVRGQCLSGDTGVLLADGSYKNIEDIQIGDMVQSYTPEGTVVNPVTHVFEPEKKELFKITLASGRTVVASADHVFAGCDRPPTTRRRHVDKGTHTLKWKSVSEWGTKQYIAVSNDYASNAAQYSDIEIELVGLMTGDGCCTANAYENNNLRFSSGRLDTAQRFVDLCAGIGVHASITSTHKGNNYDVRIWRIESVQRMWDLLTRAGIAGCYSYQKSLSNELLWGTKRQRQILLGALIATDGWICSNGRTGEVAYCTTSEKLANQVLDLFMSLGATANLYTKEKWLDGTQHRDQFVVSVRGLYVAASLLVDVDAVGKEDSKNKLLETFSRSIVDGTKYSYVNNYYLDRIKSIESLGLKTAYDIEVAGTHNFFVNSGIISHNSAGVIYLDEMDMIPEDILLKVIQPLLLTKKDVMFIATSTPIGKEGKFKTYCLERPDFKEDYLPSTVLPQWEDIKDELKSDNTADGFAAEYMAHFIEGSYGVFKPNYVYRARGAYTYADSDVNNASWWRESAGVQNRSDLLKVMGIDWNKNAGTEFVVVAYDPNQHHWFVVEAVNIAAGEWSSVEWKQEVIRLNYKWKPDYIYADEGYGHTIIEDLKVEAHRLRAQTGLNKIQQQTVKLIDKLIAFNFSQKVELRSPIDGQIITKTGKEFLVENAVRVFEEGRLWFPEDDITLLKQLQHYVILRRHPTTNKPVYGTDNNTIGDHRLDALMLALAGLFLEKSMYSSKTSVGSQPTSLSKDYLDKRSGEEKYGAADVIKRLRNQTSVDINVLEIRRGTPQEEAHIRRIQRAEDILKANSGRSRPGASRSDITKTQGEGVFEYFNRKAKSNKGYSTDTEALHQAGGLSRPGMARRGKRVARRSSGIKRRK